MQEFSNDRRLFFKQSVRALITTAAGSSLAFAAMRAHAGQSAVTQTRKTQAAMTPQQALQMLKDGNRRFLEGNPLQRDLMQQIKATAAGQFPFAVLVSCIDSRESSHLIFDQGIGDIFNARVAGNFVNDDILGSLEFACAATGAKLIVVMGHTECGAVKGACDDVVLGNLTQTLANIKPAVAAVSGYEADRSSKNAKFVQAVADKNVALTVARIRERSPILRDMAEKGQIGLTGAMYNVHDGRVTFM
ncbi:MAG: carbonic anhydrase family protein [Desulfobacterales bacterium]|nr:carbonic anhydrase family protein [Desulfobacterales bacterium]